MQLEATNLHTQAILAKYHDVRLILTQALKNTIPVHHALFDAPQVPYTVAVDMNKGARLAHFLNLVSFRSSNHLTRDG